MKIFLSNDICITDSPPSLSGEIRRSLTMPNPAWIENEKMGRWNGASLPELKFWAQDQHGLHLPRGFYPRLVSMARRAGEEVEIVDRLRMLPRVDFNFSGELRDFQRIAVDMMLTREAGILEAPTGCGKTVIALCLIAHRRQPTLIVVHTKELLHQWVDRIEEFLELPKREIGIIGAGKHTVGQKITVALVQSLYKVAAEISPRIGYLIIDECHRAPSRTFSEAVLAFDCRYLTGLSATPWRRDGLSKLIYFFIGDRVHLVERSGLVQGGDVLPAEVVIRHTDFEPFADPTTEYTKMLSELTEDAARNRLIAMDVAKEAAKGAGICLVLTDRKAHCDQLNGALERLGVPSSILTGEVCATERKQIVADLNAGGIRVLIATGQLMGEGFDCAGLSTLFLATPIKFDGRVLQYLGRVLRPAPGKTKARVFDYCDGHVGVLRASARARERVFQRTA